MTESYKLPKDIIELLINKYAPHGECCDFCDRIHVLKDVCWMCKNPKVRCGTRCRKIEICAICNINVISYPCKSCTLKKNYSDPGRQAIRRKAGKLIESMICNECLALEPCKHCKSIMQCTYRCPALTSNK